MECTHTLFFQAFDQYEYKQLLMKTYKFESKACSVAELCRLKSSLFARRHVAMWACAIHSMENVQTLSLQNQYLYWLHNYTPDREKMLLIIVLNVFHSEYACSW